MEEVRSLDSHATAAIDNRTLCIDICAGLSYGGMAESIKGKHLVISATVAKFLKTTGEKIPPGFVGFPEHPDWQTAQPEI